MIKSKFIQNTNLENLIFISNELKEFDPFVQFGTLLGLTRENNILKNDDDIDLCLNFKFKENAVKKLHNLNDYKINYKVCNKYFIQLIKKKNNINTFVDLYFYIDHNNFIEEKHNFFASISLESHSIHIPKKLIFPLLKSKKYKNINLPNQSKELCKFFYGDNWEKPMNKNSDYRFEIIDHKPKLIKRSFLGSITRSLKNFFSKKFKKI